MIKTYRFMPAYFAGLLVFGSHVACASDEVDQLLAMPLENLEQVQVSSVSRHPENRFEAPAATTVITADDIRRSGATNVPDILRQVPGLEVAQIDANKWAVTSRGFNREFANKLLVLIDGRSVYTPLFAGTFWDEQDPILEDIERIEVIRGPGATLWGSNAVNGVINIITKKAVATQGTFVSTTYGTQDKGTTAARFGASQDQVNYRVSGKFRNVDSFDRVNGEDANDDWRSGQTGFRADWNVSTRQSMSLIGNAYQGRENRDEFFPGLLSPVAGAEKFEGFNLLGRWETNPSLTQNTTLSAYVDHDRRVLSNALDARVDTFDVDFQNSFELTTHNQLTWGLGYRLIQDDIESSPYGGIKYIAYTPEESANNLYSAFVQNKTALISEKLFLTLGSKFEHNYYTGLEPQPNARLSWLITDRQTLWTSVSRAVRIPSRGERTISLVNTALSGGNYLRLVGDSDFDSEKLTAYEVGYRIEPSAAWSFDVATFYNNYNSLRSYESNGTLNVPLGNAANADTYGIEVSARWLVTKTWNLYASYSYLDLHIDLDQGSLDTITPQEAGTSPQHHFNLMSRLNLPHDMELDNNLYYVSDVASYKIGGYTRFDTRLGWRPTEALEFSLVGQNLLDSGHQEFAPYLFSTPIEIPRTVYGEVKVHF